MAARACAHCGKPLPPNASPKAKYCSDSCRVLACRQRRREGRKPKPRTTTPHEAKGRPLTGNEFERMMDGRLEDVLRATRNRLQQALADPDTPANALPAISRQLIAVCRELESQLQDDPLLDIEDEPMEVNEDAGASIV